MGSKFIPPPDQINTISSKKSKKSFSDLSSQSIFHEMKRNIRDSYKYDAFEQVGQLSAVVLEVIDEEPTKMLWKNPLMSYAFYEKNTMPDYVEIRFRVPELHAHLPEPESPEDFIAINRHPKAIMKKDKGIPEVGDIVTLDFKDKNNFTHAMVVETLNSNEGPNPGGNCSPAAVFESGTPPLNVSQPTGDSQSQPPSAYSAKNDPAEEAYEEGINYADGTTPDNTIVYDRFLIPIYVITIDDFNTLPEFKDIENMADILATKNAFSLCFEVGNSERLLRDTKRLIKIIDNLTSKNFDCSLMINSDSSPDDSTVEERFSSKFVHMANIAKQTKLKSINFRVDKITTSGSSYTLFRTYEKVFRNFADSIKVDFYLTIEEETNVFKADMPKNDGLFLADNIFLTANYYDYNREKNSSDKTNAKLFLDGDLSYMQGEEEKFIPSFYLSGINFLANLGDDEEDNDCLYGRRTKNILENDFDKFEDEYGTGVMSLSNILFFNFSSLEPELSKEIRKKWVIHSDSASSKKKQSLLNSDLDIQKQQNANVTDVEASPVPVAIEPPTFNSDTSTGSQNASPTPSSPESPSSPGAQCTPIDAGAAALGSTNAGAAGSGAPVTPPSYRFDSIENYQNLGWAASAHHIINDVIFEFMERFSAAVYRRLPANSPSFTGSVPKKIKLTSTARTAAKQVELMWDKIRQGGDNAVWDLYGRSSWVQTVVTGYHNNDSATPIGVIQGRIDSGVVTGHLSGKGVDVHTWSHLDAEGISSNGASVATMNSSKFVQAIVAAARECNARPVVESYQQHVHITIL